MPIQNDSLNRDLYDLLNSRGYDPIPRDSDAAKAGKTVPPEEADVFKFTFKQQGEDVDYGWVTVDGTKYLIVYFDEDIGEKAGTRSKDSDFDDSWYGFLTFLKKWAFSKRLKFMLEPKQKIDSDMAKRTYMKKKEQIAEGYYPMGKSASYNDNIPTVKIILQHTRQIQEGEQRYRNVAKIFLENTEGERILAPTKKPGLAQIYARHLAEGGVPNDERWNHIKSLCEEYQKMAGFVRAVRGNQFNESAQRLVEAGLNHYQSIRESLSKMRGHRGYTAYFESWTPTLMETEGDEQTNLNELFVQETLDPRIESVMPILSKLKVNLGEMKEVDELAEWADNLLEAPGAETLSHNQDTEKSNLKAFDLAEDDLQEPAIEELEEEAMEESGLQAYLGNKKYGKEGMDALRKAGREHAGKEEMAKIRAKYDKLDEEDMEEGLAGAAIGGIAGAALTKTPSGAMAGAELGSKLQDKFTDNKEVDEGALDTIKNVGKKVLDKIAPDDEDLLKRLQKSAGIPKHAQHGKPRMAMPKEEEVSEDLDANQKRAGQLGPTEKVKNNNIGKLVGANESKQTDENFINMAPQAVAEEVDTGEHDARKKQPSSKEEKDKVFTKHRERMKNLDKEDKEEVKEGQEDLDAILRIIKK
jgi:hypothetical protein